MQRPGNDTIILRHLDRFIFSLWNVFANVCIVSQSTTWTNPALNSITLSPIASVVSWVTECRLALMTYSRSAAKLPPGHHGLDSPGPSAGLHGCSLRIDKQSHCSRGKHTGVATRTGKRETHMGTCNGKRKDKTWRCQESRKFYPAWQPPRCFSIHFSFSCSPTEPFSFPSAS